MKGKTYRVVLNKWDVELCARTLNISRKRTERYLKALMKKVEADYGSLRLFWSDVIMLNMMTTKLLKAADPREIEKILSPLRTGEKEEVDG